MEEKKKVLITGITGFSGSHLAEYLLKEGYDVYGTIRGRCRQMDFISHIKNRITLLECDLTDPNSVYATVKDSYPDVIYHLAAQTFVPTSWRAPQETMSTNILGTLNILESVRKSECNPIILITGSSEEYGYVHASEIPIKETNPLRPLSPYGVSKVAQDLLGYQYFKSYGLKIIRTRSFNLIGPRSGDKIFTASFSKQIAEIESGKKKPILSVGNLQAVRDLNDIRDNVRAYELCVEKCSIGEVYNISTGEGCVVGDILDKLLEMSIVDIKIRKDPMRMRPSDVQVLVGDSTKFREETGWKPEYTIDMSLKDILNYWREKVQNSR